MLKNLLLVRKFLFKNRKFGVGNPPILWKIKDQNNLLLLKICNVSENGNFPLCRLFLTHDAAKIQTYSRKNIILSVKNLTVKTLPIPVVPSCSKRKQTNRKINTSSLQTYWKQPSKKTEQIDTLLNTFPDEHVSLTQWLWQNSLVNTVQSVFIG